MGRALAVAGAIAISVFSSTASADTLPAALTPPLPTLEQQIPTGPAAVVNAFKRVSFSAPEDGQHDPAHIFDQSDISAFGLPCGPKLTAKAVAQAQVDVTITAPCRPAEQLRIQAEGVAFDVMLDYTGTARVKMPVLRAQTEIDVIFDDYTVLSRQIHLHGVSSYTRIALNWTKADAPMLVLGSGRAADTEIVELGDGSGQVTQVLSHMNDPVPQAGVIRLALERQTTAENCGIAQSARVFRVEPGQVPLDYTLSLAARDCDQIGRQEVLKNVLQDLKLAQH